MKLPFLPLHIYTQKKLDTAGREGEEKEKIRTRMMHNLCMEVIRLRTIINGAKNTEKRKN